VIYSPFAATNDIRRRVILKTNKIQALTCEMLHDMSFNGTMHSPISILNVGNTWCILYCNTTRNWWYVFL